MNLCEVLLEQAADRPGSAAIIEPRGDGRSSTVTFAELDTRSARGAALLRQYGLTEGARVVVLEPLSIKLYVILLALFRAGLVATLIDPAAGRGHVDSCLDRARPVGFVGSTKASWLRLVTRRLRRIQPAFCTGGFVPGTKPWGALEDLEPLRELAPVGPKDPALLTFTSGSTGAPKATVRSHGFLLAQHAALSRAIDLQADEVDLATLPVFVLANLASGVTTLLPDCDLRKPGAIDPKPVLAQLRRHSPGRTGGSPAFYERLLEGNREDVPDTRAEPSPLTRLTKLFTGGAPVFPDLLGRLQEQIPNGRIIAVYGSTEAEPIAHVEWSEFAPEDLERMATGGGLLAGLPVPEIELRILPNEAGRPIGPFTTAEFENLALPMAEPGEIVVSGKHVIESYLDGIGDEETKFSVQDQSWHRTGDAGYLDGGGRIWLLGRASAVLDDEKGTLFPFSVECAASQFPEIRRSALAAHDGRRILVLEVGRSERDGGTSSVLEGRVRESLAWACLDRVVVVPQVPVDRRHNAKIDYVALRELVEKL